MCVSADLLVNALTQFFKFIPPLSNSTQRCLFIRFERKESKPMSDIDNLGYRALGLVY